MSASSRCFNALRWTIEVFPLAAAPSSVRSAPSLLQFRLDLKTPLFQSQYSNGKKKNRNALLPNADGIRRGAVDTEDRAPKARGVSMQLEGLGECCKLPQRVQADPGRQTTFGAFLV